MFAPSMSPISGALAQLQERRASRQLMTADRLDEMEHAFLHVDAIMAQECRRRAEADDKLHASLQQRLRALESDVERDLDRRVGEIDRSTAIVAAKVEGLWSELESHRVKDEQLRSELRTISTQIRARLQQSVTEMSAARRAFEGDLVNEIRDAVAAVETAVAVESEARDATTAAVAEEARTLSNSFANGNDGDVTRAALLGGVHQLKADAAALVIERETTVSNLADMMQSLLQEVAKLKKKRTR